MMKQDLKKKLSLRPSIYHCQLFSQIKIISSNMIGKHNG